MFLYQELALNFHAFTFCPTQMIVFARADYEVCKTNMSDPQFFQFRHWFR